MADAGSLKLVLLVARLSSSSKAHFWYSNP
jgi:hypothetical protein